jgi:hypothetical protein
MIHISNKQINNIYCVSQTGLIKPQGLWYANADEWLIFFAKYNEKIKECKYDYELKLKYTELKKKNKNKILQISTENIFDKFTIKYGVVHKSQIIDDGYSIFINWAD